MSVSQIFRRFPLPPPPPLELQLGPGFAKSHIVNVFRIQRRLRDERERDFSIAVESRPRRRLEGEKKSRLRVQHISSSFSCSGNIWRCSSSSQ